MSGHRDHSPACNPQPGDTGKRTRRANALALLTIASLQLVLAGCTTTAKLNTFGELSKAGIAYVDAASAVIDQAQEGSIAADTAVLIVVRDSLPPDSRSTTLKKQSDRLVTQLGLFADIRRHQDLIKEYFVALGALADAGDADSAIGDAARDTLGALGNLSQRFGTVTVGEQPLPDFVGQTTPLIVANLRSRALERELRTNGAAINRELKVSEGLMAFLAEKIKADDAAVQGPKEAEAVFIPYTEDRPLPDDWPARRAAFLTRKADLDSIAGAQDAARKLRLALTAAAEGHLAPGQLQTLVSDLSTLVDVLEDIKTRPTP